MRKREDGVIERYDCREGLSQNVYQKQRRRFDETKWFPFLAATVFIAIAILIIGGIYIGHKRAVEAELKRDFGSKELTEEEAKEYARQIVDSAFTDTQLRALQSNSDAEVERESLRLDVLDAMSAITSMTLDFKLGKAEMNDETLAEYSSCCRQLIEGVDAFFANEIVINANSNAVLGTSSDFGTNVYEEMREEAAAAGRRLMSDVDSLFEADQAEKAAYLDAINEDAAAVYSPYERWQKASDALRERMKDWP